MHGSHIKPGFWVVMNSQLETIFHGDNHVQARHLDDPDGRYQLRIHSEAGGRMKQNHHF
jgi:hypothetical protein